METIIIFRIGSIGDTVVALPCFHRIARSFPNFRRIVVTDVPASQKASSVESVLGNSGLIDGVIYFLLLPESFVIFCSYAPRFEKPNPQRSSILPTAISYARYVISGSSDRAELDVSSGRRSAATCAFRGSIPKLDTTKGRRCAWCVAWRRSE